MMVSLIAVGLVSDTCALPTWSSRKERFLEILEALSSKCTNGELLDIFYGDSPMLSVSKPDCALLLVEGTNVYVTNRT